MQLKARLYSFSTLFFRTFKQYSYRTCFFVGIRKPAHHLKLVDDIRVLFITNVSNWFTIYFKLCRSRVYNTIVPEMVATGNCRLELLRKGSYAVNPNISLLYLFELVYNWESKVCLFINEFNRIDFDKEQLDEKGADM